MSLFGIPMIHQLRYLSNIQAVSDWIQFTRVYLLISTLIVETNLRSIKEFFLCFINLLPEHVCFYFEEPISPNEWHCFLLSLNYFHQIEILYIDTHGTNPDQFRSLLHQLSSCSLSYLSIGFFNRVYESIKSYTSLLCSTDISINYKISLSFKDCLLTESGLSSLLFPTINNKWTGSIRLDVFEISNEILTHLTNQFSCIENIFYVPQYDYSDWSIILIGPLALISNNSQIKGLYIWDLKSYLPEITDILSGLSSLEELHWYKEDPYTVLPYLQTNNSLKYLALHFPTQPPLRENYKQQLIRVISNNSTSLKDLQLGHLNTVGLNSWTSILTPIQSCCNLVSLSLTYSPFSSDDISYWDLLSSIFSL